MKTLKLSQASRPLSEYASELTEDIVLVTERNKPVAAVVSLRNVDREVLALGRSSQFFKIIQRSRRDFTAGRSRPLAEVRAEVDAQGRAAKPAPRRSRRPRKDRSARPG